MNIYSILQERSHNAHHLDRYWKFILHCQSIESELTGYLEEHHILPKAKDLFPEYASFTDHPWNRVLLTARQHIIAHYMLMKVYETHSTSASVQFTAGQHYSPGFYCSALLARARIINAERRSRLKFFHIPETRECRMFEDHPGEPWIAGHGPRSATQCKTISESQLGLARGRVFWTDGVDQVRSVERPGEGWVLGLSPAAKEKRKNDRAAKRGTLHWWNDGKENAMVSECPGEGWVPGRTQETKDKNRLLLIGNRNVAGLNRWNNGVVNKLSKEKPHSGEWISGYMSETTSANPGSTGMKWWTNGNENMLTLKYPGEGWRLGQTKKNTSAYTELKWWNNGVVNKRAKEQPEGWIPGCIREHSKKKVVEKRPGSKSCWNNGKENRVVLECPGEGWVLGRIQAEGKGYGTIGLQWWNDGNVNIAVKESPAGDQWKRGLLRKKK